MFDKLGGGGREIRGAGLVAVSLVCSECWQVSPNICIQHVCMYVSLGAPETADTNQCLPSLYLARSILDGVQSTGSEEASHVALWGRVETWTPWMKLFLVGLAPDLQ
jgi:hypothetical protein